ncbi:Arm DNA-binding domain-containing protein [Spirillospora sp. NPDC029432]|uniref:Arm DNA-binding domain-containing protein n=1 Tax=Spirillospora sp. NPDC029432 TaxID=3154599 RepID=UPI0034533303
MIFTKSAGGVYRRCGCIDPQSGSPWGSACPKLSHGGRHGSWYIGLELPPGPDGRRRRVRRGGFPTRKAAEEALAQLRMPGHGETGPGMVTVGEWLGQPVPALRPPFAGTPATSASTWPRTWARFSSQSCRSLRCRRCSLRSSASTRPRESRSLRPR